MTEHDLPTPAAIPRRSLEEARAFARERFKSRLDAGEKVGACSCHDEEKPFAAAPGESDSPAEPAASVAGVRFRDSGRTFYFRADTNDLEIGQWVVVETSRGQEAGRVVIAPHQVRLNLLQGELKPILRFLDDDEVQRLGDLKGDAAGAVKTFGAHLRLRRLTLKPISAEYAFDGSSVTLHYSLPNRERAPDASVLRHLTKELEQTLERRVELRQVGPRDEARLLGGVGRCGRTLCCSSWLPVYPEISMNMAKTQDLPLNPGKVSGVCGRLLCCLSYENEQYKQMKAVMPRLGQSIETPAGPGMVVSMQILKELVTVRLHDQQQDIVFSSEDLGMGSGDRGVAAIAAPSGTDEQPLTTESDDPSATSDSPSREGPSSGRRRRRRRGKRGGAE